MAKRVGGVRSGRVNRVAGQTGCRLKMDHFKWVKKGFELIGLRVESGRVGLAHIFHIIFFF